MGISVIIPTIGRATLSRAIESIAPQLSEGDEILVEVDMPPHKDDGNHARDVATTRATGTHLWYMDDDDAALPGALAAMRRAIGIDPNAAWVFRVDLNGEMVWSRRGEIGPGNQCTLCYLVPKSAAPLWAYKHGSNDFHFIQNVRAEKRWADDVVAVVRPKDS